MGAVRTRVKLTNDFDRALVCRGKLERNQIRTYETDAIADTDVIRCSLPSYIVEHLGLQIAGERVVEFADGRRETVPITEPFIVEILGRKELETALVLGDESWIGHTALAKLDLVIDRINQRLIPNPAHPDQPVSKIK
ncbi:MAG: clan AA aspartic protease [Candidatus Sumerlaeota bacterium]|nr:clan AA aspartic protease [Candidatus Sumerlaeota bacterium]